jgi:hypothetical protein
MPQGNLQAGDGGDGVRRCVARIALPGGAGLSCCCTSGGIHLPVRPAANPNERERQLLRLASDYQPRWLSHRKHHRNGWREVATTSHHVAKVPISCDPTVSRRDGDAGGELDRGRRQGMGGFMMRFELGLEEPPKRASRSAFTIALSYIAGGLVPLAPYFFFASVHSALIWSVVVTLLALLMFGYIKGQFTTARPLRRAWQTVVVGRLSATAAFAISKAIG